MGQSKTEYARRRREALQGRENLSATLNPSTGMVMITKHAAGTDTIFDADGVIYNVTRIYEIAKERPDVCGPFPCLMSDQFIRYMLQNPHLDKERAKRIPLDAAMASPFLSVGDRNRGSMILDGQHRAFRLYHARIGDFLSYIVPPSLLPPPVVRTFKHISECPREIVKLAIASLNQDFMDGMEDYASERGMTIDEMMGKDDSYTHEVMSEVARRGIK